ncbi:MAG: band 7 domain-containing protein [Candidatus Yanofskybacteria bacterium RIFCSPLOWO2_02_FULL_45_10]|uniref:Band 7 domain-containing protein n=2 Tax=Candidatus Yanofskyibacteriota TaxID=1752733 RepID=A0A1F8G5R7_9BACT|nr:MAG: band 7 domain-containing protein [Candidatus Yanofskybacteria bacterium RIFCSPHIGHO2_12_FULL_45_19b]OGN31752.1 MAG: band 7 domain-containing protein [Candidatus Yanofskybacteria bacterium RIFCSPLOWO2_02_FULL_45_10]
MDIFLYLVGAFVFLVLPGLRTVQQYQQGVVFRFGKIVGLRGPGLNMIIPYFESLRKVDLRTVTLPVPAQKIITKDNVSVDVSAVAYYRIVNVVKSIVAIQDVQAAIDQIAQTSLRNIVGKFQLDEILSERETINAEITKILDSFTESWGVVVSSVEIKDIQLPDDMQRAIAKQAEAEREKRAKIISAEGEFLSAQKLADTADIMMAHPIALQLRNLQTLAEIATEKNSTIIFPAQLMGTIADIHRFLAEEKQK